MKKFILFLLLFVTPLFASDGAKVIDGYLQPAGYVRISSLSSAVGLGTIPTGTKLILIQPETQSVRWRDDGTNPTASIGNLLAANSVLSYNGDPQAFKVIETTTSAILNVSFYR